MNDGRFVVAQFCDDIRHELGNKHSLIGCYQDEVILDKLPGVLPRFCAQVQVISPLERPIEDLKVRWLLNGDVIGEVNAKPRSIRPTQITDPKAPPPFRESVLALLVVSPLFVQEASTLRVEAETEEGVIKGSMVRIRARTPSDTPFFPQKRIADGDRLPEIIDVAGNDAPASGSKRATKRSAKRLPK